MLKDIKEILFAEIKEKVTEYEEISNKIIELKDRRQKITTIIGGFGVSENEDVDKLNKPKKPSMIIKNFSFWDKWLFNRKEYQQIERLNKEAQEKYKRELEEYNEKKEKYNAEKSFLDKEISELENKIKEIDGKNNKDIRTRFEMIKNAKTLKELNLSFEEAKKILEDNDKEIVLDESDREITANESDFDKTEDFILVHKTAYTPTDDEIKSNRNARAKLKQTVYFGEEEFSFEYEIGRNTVHLCQNGEVSSHASGYFDDRKYAVLIPFKNVRNDKNITSFNPEDTFFDGNVNIKEGYILCPIDEVETIKNNNLNSNVIGYEGESVDGFAASFLSMLGYKHKEISEHSWAGGEIDREKHRQFMAKNPDLSYKTHDGSEESFRDEFLEKFNQIIGLTESVIQCKSSGKKYDVFNLTKVLLSSGMNCTFESGKAKKEIEKYYRSIGPSFTSLLNKAHNPHNEENLYLKDIIQDENFEDNTENCKDSNANFLYYKLEKEFNIKMPQDVKELLHYNGNNIEEFIKLIQDEDTKKLLNEMKVNGEITSVDKVKDVVFLKTIIEQVYREQILDKKELKTKDIAEADKSMEIASSETYEAEQILENLKEKDKEIEEKQD